MSNLYCHPEYIQKRDDWEKWRILYDGKHSDLVKPGLLWQHAIEAKDGDNNSKRLRSGREQRTRYLNLIEILISLWTSWFFRKSPNMSAIEGLLGPRKDDIDGRGTSFESFVKNELLRNYLLYGKSIILVQNSSFIAETRAQESELGINPKMSILDPMSCVDWDLEVEDAKRVGELNLFRYEFNLIEPRSSSTQKPIRIKHSHEYVRESAGKVRINRYKQPQEETLTVKYENNQQLISSSWIDQEPAEIDLSEIPIVIIESQSWIKDAAEECLRVHNLRSNRDNILYFQGYRTDYITGIDTGNPDQLKAFSEYTKVLLPAGAGVIFTDPVSTDQYDKAIQQAIDTTFKVGLNLFRTLPEDSRVGQSAESMAEAKDNPLALVEASLEDIENGINQALERFAEFKGVSNPPKIELDKNISEISAEQFIATVQGLSDYYRGVEVVSKMIAKEGLKFLKLDDENLKKAEEAIDATPISTPRTNGIVTPGRNDLIRTALNGGSRTKEAPGQPRQAGSGVPNQAQ